MEGRQANQLKTISGSPAKEEIGRELVPVGKGPFHLADLLDQETERAVDESLV